MRRLYALRDGYAIIEAMAVGRDESAVTSRERWTHGNHMAQSVLCEG